MKKYYTYAMILYKDSEIYDYKKVIKYIEKNWKQYAYIEHDKDEETKKKHTHLLVHFPNKRYVTAISKEIGVPVNYIESCNLVPYLRYLIHFDDEEKHQYSVEEVKGPLQSTLKEIISNNKLSEVQQVSIISSYIFESGSWLSHSSLLQFVLANGCYSAYRRNFTLFDKLILEHNKNL